MTSMSVGPVVPVLDRDAVRAKLASGAPFKLVMAASEFGFRAKHIPGSLRADPRGAAFLGLAPDDDVVVYCSNVDCIASSAVIKRLLEQGYRNVSHYPGGLIDWEDAGLPLEGDWASGPSGAPISAMEDTRIVGRSSSLFTRVARIFAGELGVPYAFDIVADLGSRERHDYAGNPALKIPTLRRSGELLFGTLNICRALAEAAAAASTRPLWPEDLDGFPLRNAHELTQAAMTTEVSIIMARHGGVAQDNGYSLKLRDSLNGTLGWLDALVTGEGKAFPTRDRLSYLEVSLYCLVTHIEFRDLLDTSPYGALRAFRDRFGERAAARDTPFKFDAASVHR